DDDAALAAVLAAVGDAAAELDRRVGRVGLGQPGGGAAEAPVALVAAEAGGQRLVRLGGEGGLDLGQPLADQAQAARGDEVGVGADRELGQRLGARAVVFLHECPAHLRTSPFIPR